MRTEERLRPAVRGRRRRPMLLALVYGVFLVLVGVTATGLVAVASVHLSNATLQAFVERDSSLVELFVNGNLQPADLDADGPSPLRRRQLEAELGSLVARDSILRIEILGSDGEVLAAAPAAATQPRAPSSEMQRALGGEPSIALVNSGADDAPPLPEGVESVVREYLPIVSEDGSTLALVALWRDAAGLLARLEAARWDVMVVTVAAALVLAAILFVIFRAAQSRLARQQERLIEAERRDALTDMLNHGTVVGLLADLIEEARGSGGRIGLALVDLDNFSLFNDNHGHDAADGVLLRVADLVAREASGQMLAARYGPDEFLIVHPGADTEAMGDIVSRIMAGVGDLSVQFGDSEQLPVTVSVGICAYPDHATSVTELLSAAAVAVAEAKASGGNAVRVARLGEAERTSAGSFDVLQGLVLAVDTKDRYTKRHSEDVARYALFLADRLGVDDEMRQTIRLAGLLHDVGKIGIPDTILRKPAKLTADEYHVFKQHVALGDAIVRDLPNVDTVRAGIRHHHERWDGRGYLDGLEGEEIPLIGRILAVADAFSAMTTTRPYRKALPVEEALKRLGDAAGTQLEEELVRLFIDGIESAPDAPLPGEEPGPIWQPERRVA